jgi:hypothetical protein
MWVDPLADLGSNGDGADDLADALAHRNVERWPRTFAAAGEQRSCPSRVDMRPQ